MIQVDEKKLIEEKLEKYYKELTQYLKKCKSPIEKIMAVELADMDFRDLEFECFDIIEIVPQKHIYVEKKHYIADFFLAIDFKLLCRRVGGMFLIIECDGHDFHEKTKEQVKNDNQRNRDLINNNFHVLHFSGSEIYNTPEFCKSEIKKYIIHQYYKFIDNYKGD